MEWISVTERLPLIAEEVELSNGFITNLGFIWDHCEGGSYFELKHEDERFMPLWWRPYKGFALDKAFEENTYVPKRPE